MLQRTPGFQQNLFEKNEPEWVEIDVKRVRVENVVEFWWAMAWIRIDALFRVRSIFI